jgi:hypothetical protein
MEARAFRTAAKPKSIGDVRIEDGRISIVGIVVGKDESGLVIDDGTGQATVLFDNPRWLEGVDIGSIVKVMGTPLEAEGGMEVHADLLQRMDGLDLKLYRQAMEELKKLESQI